MQKFLPKTVKNSDNNKHSDLQLNKQPTALLENAKKASAQQVFVVQKTRLNPTHLHGRALLNFATSMVLLLYQQFQKLFLLTSVKR
ncbi:hypothetical protein D5018_18670 [Parashewanella curva]|uniref:Uncharacterized protein n=1 Tax=Parashewanella curva TaxID=2338552 RepID=A0A3L8PTP9_9GAMM|nr:hypothetical protein D5018_18670 [Parashewanella curva]